MKIQMPTPTGTTDERVLSFIFVELSFIFVEGYEQVCC